MKRLRIAIASDHAGKSLKDFLLNNIFDGIVEDFGPTNTDSVDYPDYAAKVCEAIQNKHSDIGILVCGSGIGMSISANKFAGIRAAHVESTFTAQLAGEHNRANILCLGERITAPPYALAMVKAWLTAEFGGANASPDAKARHQRRIDKIQAQEKP
jgi:ribose 5-phosphate isomerase B